MKEVYDNSIVGIGGITPTGLLTSLLCEAQRIESQLTPEEKTKREERRRITEETRRRKAQVLKNICPNCESKLIRGKKEKKLDYKRLWTCKECKSRYSDEGETYNRP